MQQSFELWDINEKIPEHMLKFYVSKHVARALRKNDIFSTRTKCSVIIPAGGDDWECHEIEGAKGLATCIYNGRFMVFGSNGNTVHGDGNVVGTLTTTSKENAPFVLDTIDVSISNITANRLKNRCY